MKYISAFALTLVFLFAHGVAIACDVCQKQQPKLLRGMAHGAGPESEWDYVVVAGIALIALVSAVYAVKYIIRPGETSSHHIKRSILNVDEV